MAPEGLAFTVNHSLSIDSPKSHNGVAILVNPSTGGEPGDSSRSSLSKVKDSAKLSTAKYAILDS